MRYIVSFILQHKETGQTQEIVLPYTNIKSDETAQQIIAEDLQKTLERNKGWEIKKNTYQVKKYNFEYTITPFSIRMTYLPLNTVFVVKTPHYDKEGLKAFIEIKTTNPFATTQGTIYAANFNFYSSTGTSQLIKAFEKAFLSRKEEIERNIITFQQLVESFKEEFREIFKTPQAIDVSEVKPQEIDFLLTPYVIKNTFNLFYGIGSTGKSTFICYLANLIAQREHKVLYLDYENPTPYFIARTIKKINSDIRNIYVRCCQVPLIDEVEQIYEEAEEKKIDVIVIDSLIKAIAKDVNDASEVAKFFQYLGKIPVTWILITHVAKNNPNQDPYGSVFFYNLARNIWFIKRIADHENIILQLIHRKTNYTKLYPSSLFVLSYSEDGRLIVRQESPENVVTKKKLILLALEEKPMTLQELAKEVPSVKYPLLRKYLTQLQKEGAVVNEKGMWRLNEEQAF